MRGANLSELHAAVSRKVGVISVAFFAFALLDWMTD
jgi:hypothetical protein